MNTAIYYLFQLPNDMLYYMENHLLGSVKRILMKPMCLLSKFPCQPDRKKRTTTTPRDVFLKRQRKELIDQLLYDDKENEPEEVSMNITHLAESSSTGNNQLTLRFIKLYIMCRNKGDRILAI